MPQREVAGDIAVEIARQLADPVRALRDRQDLAATYLEATTLARRLDELDRALDDDPPSWFDLATSVDLGLRLAGHHLATGIELMIDLANTPLVRGTPGTLALLI